MRLPISQSYLTQLLYLIADNFHQNEITIKLSHPRYDEESQIERLQNKNNHQIQKIAKLIKARQWNEFLDNSHYLNDFATYRTRHNQNHPEINLFTKQILTFHGMQLLHRDPQLDDAKPNYLKTDY